jgi:hypothetical protein
MQEPFDKGVNYFYRVASREIHCKYDENEKDEFEG